MDLTVSDMIQYFEDKIQYAQQRNINNSGEQPGYPMLVIFLGDDAIKSYSAMASKLFQLWPSYAGAFCFIGVTGRKEEIEYFHLSVDNGQMEQTRQQEDEVQNLIAALRSRSNNFNSYEHIFTYFVMSTAGLTGVSEYSSWMDVYLKVKKVLALDSARELFMLMLDESTNIQQEISRKLRNYISDENHVVPQILLLSNRDSGNGITNDWAVHYTIMADMIALTNNCNTQISNILFQEGVYTVSYMREEKPVKEIGWVIATQILDRLDQMKGSKGARNLFKADDIDNRLGLTEAHTFKILDSYVEENLFPMLPKEEQLYLFPRKDNACLEDIDRLSAEKFNEITMNSWQRYLERILKKAEEIDSESLLKEQWRKKYDENLKDAFSVDELAVLGENPERITLALKKDENSFRETGILNDAKYELKHSFSSNKDLLAVFTDVIRKRGCEAQKLLAVWEHLLASRLDVHSVDDKTIINYYSQKIRDYFDSKEKELLNEYKKISETEELEKFLRKIIEEIIYSDPIFSEPFEQERAGRMQRIDANQDIQENLTDRSRMYQYLRIGFQFKAPRASIVMLKFDTPLEAYMRGNLEEYYYYNTGCGNMAEVIEIYQIEKNDLVYGEAH